MQNSQAPYRSPFSGGANVVDCLLRNQFGYSLTEAQAQTLWTQCRKRLLETGLKDTVEEAESSVDGSMDTLPRGDVQDMLAEELVNRSWPVYMDGPDAIAQFRTAVQKEAQHRGFSLATE